jgi:hypothetical protein
MGEMGTTEQEVAAETALRKWSSKVRGVMDGEMYNVTFYQEWTEWLARLFRRGHFNWYNFHLVEVSFEDEVCTANRELVIFLLGFGLRVQWATGRTTPMMEEIKQRAIDMKMHPEAALDLKDVIGDE